METSTLSTDQLRDYAAGTLGWAALKHEVGYAEVLGGLGTLGLRPPTAPMAGLNLEARRRGVNRLRELLSSPQP